RRVVLHVGVLDDDDFSVDEWNGGANRRALPSIRLMDDVPADTGRNPSIEELGRPVPRSVVDSDDLSVDSERLDALENLADRPSFVEHRDDEADPRRRRRTRRWNLEYLEPRQDRRTLRLSAHRTDGGRLAIGRTHPGG